MVFSNPGTKRFWKHTAQQQRGAMAERSRAQSWGHVHELCEMWGFSCEWWDLEIMAVTAAQPHSGHSSSPPSPLLPCLWGEASRISLSTQLFANFLAEITGKSSLEAACNVTHTGTSVLLPQT